MRVTNVINLYDASQRDRHIVFPEEANENKFYILSLALDRLFFHISIFFGLEHFFLENCRNAESAIFIQLLVKLFGGVK